MVLQIVTLAVAAVNLAAAAYLWCLIQRWKRLNAAWFAICTMAWPLRSRRDLMFADPQVDEALREFRRG